MLFIEYASFEEIFCCFLIFLLPLLFAFKTELLIDDSGILQIYDMGSHQSEGFHLAVTKVNIFIMLTAWAQE